MKPQILVAGGAGYIGAHMCKYLFQHGYQPVVLDNLVYGHAEAVKWGPLVQGDMADPKILAHIFSRYDIAAAMHFAAFCYVGESVTHPARYYQNNVAGTLNLLEGLLAHDIKHFIFSSSCATYGEPLAVPIPESHPQNPINPYGQSKLMVERILEDYRTAYGLRSVSLRYFNAAGADPDGEIGEDHQPETHLIPLVLRTALGQREAIQVFGDDYPTPDGTCIRDYIHVQDLAQAHLLALETLLDGGAGGTYNLGNGDGYSVQQVIAVAREVTGHAIPARVSPRRPGDPAMLVGSCQKAAAELGWQPRFGELASIIRTAWNWHQGHPQGF